MNSIRIGVCIICLLIAVVQSFRLESRVFRQGLLRRLPGVCGTRDQSPVSASQKNSAFVIFSHPVASEDVSTAAKKVGSSTTVKDSKLNPKELLAKYGIAYLATSISFAIVSFASCYILVSNGVDVASLLQKVGISSTAANTKTGTLAIAYALHKAASPVRFPPTVLLTPFVANMMGKKPGENKKVVSQSVSAH